MRLLAIKALTLLLSITVGLAFGAIWFVIVNAIEEFQPLDSQSILVGYATIGAVSGLFSWYVAMLVNRGSVHLGSAILFLAIPYVLIFLVSVNKNPATQCAVVVLFALAVLPLHIVARNKSKAMCHHLQNDNRELKAEESVFTNGDKVGMTISLTTVLVILTGYGVVLGVDRIAQLDGFMLLAYGGFLSLAGIACNRMPVFVLGLLTSAITLTIHAVVQQ